MAQLASEVSAILLDIEGTTTPLAFVHEVLFPFARAHLREFLENNLNALEVRQDLELVRRESEIDRLKDSSVPTLENPSHKGELEPLVDYLHWLMDRDRKSTGLKSLQGRIWDQGYRAGKLKALVFADVPPAFERWRNGGYSLNIFSSGSVLAQRLLFSHTDAGDLTGLLDHYFDTTTGPKNAADSYRRIAHSLKRAPAAVLFISDVVVELDAARAAGMNTLLCVRPGNHPQPAKHSHALIHGFNEIL